MQTLSQPEANRLKEVLEYARIAIKHPEHLQFYVQDHLSVDGYRPIVPTPTQIREAAERRASAIERYERFISDLDELLTIIKTFDYANSLDAATVESAIEPKVVALGDLLAAPDQYEHLGKRGEAEPILSEDKL